MTKPTVPPAQNPIVETDNKGVILPDGKVSQDWYLFFDSLLSGDTGVSGGWQPTYTGLGTTGTPTITGNYYTNQGFTDFWIKIVPGVNTTSTQGTTYFDLPFLVTVDGACLVGGTPGAVGLIDSTNKRCYPPGWTNNTSTLTITGRAVSQ